MIIITGEDSQARLGFGFFNLSFEEGDVMRSGDEMLKQIVEKSSLDSEFRQELLADPKSAICKELDITMPDSMSIQVHESDMQTVHIALPPDANITEEQLEAVSAGLCCCW